MYYSEKLKDILENRLECKDYGVFGQFVFLEKSKMRSSWKQD